MAWQSDSPPAGHDLAPRTGWLSDDEQRAWRIMVEVYARLVARLDAELQAAHGISLRDYQVLVQLSEAEGAALRMAELAESLFVSPSGLTRRLDGMVRDGLVKRQACLSDRRGTLAVLSEAGWSVLVSAAPTHVAGVRRYVFEPVDPAQMPHLISSLSAMTAVLETTGASDTDPASRPPPPPRPSARRPPRPPPPTRPTAR